MMKYGRGLWCSIVFFLFLVHSSVQWSDCGRDATIHFNNFNIQSAKGNVSVSFNGTLSNGLHGPSQVRVNVEKNEMGPWTQVPCINKIGSCNYTDMCDFVKTFFNRNSCPAVLKGCNGHSLYDPITFYFDKTTFNLGTAAEGAKNFLTGTALRVQVEMIEQDKIIGCLAFFTTLELPCTGFMCT